MEERNLELTTECLKSILGKSSDIQFRRVYINENKQLPVTLLYIQGLVDTESISSYILTPLSQNGKWEEVESEKQAIELIEAGAVYFAAQKIRTDINEVITDIMGGNSALIFDGAKTAISFATGGYEKRSISEPTDESIIKGPKDSFVEALRVNTATIRRKLKTKDLVIEETTVGKKTATTIAIVYLDDAADKQLLQKVKKRLDNIEVDGVLASGFIEENIIDDQLSLFPQVISTERPDKFCSNILSGRIGLVIDGIPVTHIIPGVLNDFLQASEDYSQHFIVSSLIRLMRYLLMILTLFLPAFFISITTFNQDMIPTELAMSINASKQNTPFPTFIEVLLMLAAFEVLQEAAARMPGTLGQAVSIMGGLVIGGAAVDANFVSPAVLIMIAFSAISSFTMVNQDFTNAIRVWRLILAILSSIGGLFGLSMGALFLLFHLSRLETFGIPYLIPLVSNDSKHLGDTFIRIPLESLKKWPHYLKRTDKNLRKRWSAK